MTEYVSLKFDPNQMIHLLGVQLYDTPLAMLRENVQNAVDAIRERAEMDSRPFVPQVKVTIANGQIVISDNGKGMTKNILENNYWTAGNSSKNTEEAQKAGVVGHFGIGALANFGICSKLELSTRYYDSNVRYNSVAFRNKLSGKDISVDEEEDTSDNYGTMVKVTLLDAASVTVEQAKDYLHQYVRYVDIPIYINGDLISQEEVIIKERTSSTFLKDHYKGSFCSFSYELVFNKFQPISPEILITDIELFGRKINGKVYLKNDGKSNGIMGLCNGFGLARLNLISWFNFSGFMDFDFLQPTAGREAVSRDSNTTALSFFVEVERFWANIISGYGLSDNYRDFLSYVVNHYSNQLVMHLTASIASNSDESICFKDITDPQKFIYYAGSDESTIKSYASSEKTLLRLAKENPRRKAQKMFFDSIGIEEVGNKIELLKVYSKSDLDLDEVMLLAEIEKTMEDDYIISDFKVCMADISMGVMYHVVSENDSFTIYLARGCSEVKTLIKVYRGDFKLFTPMVKDFVRASLYNLFAEFIPRDQKIRAAYINRMLSDSREEYTISYKDYGDYRSIYESIKGDDAKIEQFIDYLSRERQIKTEQEVDSGQVGDVESVVQTINSPSTLQSTPTNVYDMPKAQPPILELENETELKLLRTTADTPILHGNKMFIALSDSMNREFRSFFLLAHSTKVIWSMHRIIYIFSDITSTMSLYYEMELCKKLPEELTGGEQVITTTIVTDKKIFVPVVPQLYNYFDIRNGESMKFLVHFDKVYDAN